MNLCLALAQKIPTCVYVCVILPVLVGGVLWYVPYKNSDSGVDILS